jgi:F-type H+-transporting ATPase subunit b
MGFVKKMFDFDATLPLMALQFIVLAVLLNAVFYKPIGKALDERADYIRTNETKAREKLEKAQALAQEYEKQLADARRQSQQILALAQAEAKTIADEKIAQGQREAIAEKEKAAQEIEQQKQNALRALEQQVDALSRQILEKILGPEFV